MSPTLHVYEAVDPNVVSLSATCPLTGLHKGPQSTTSNFQQVKDIQGLAEKEDRKKKIEREREEDFYKMYM